MVLPRNRAYKAKDERRMRVPRAEPYIAAFLLLISSLSLIPSASSADPVDTDNPDDTRTVVWDFDDQADYAVTDVDIIGGSATLRFLNESYTTDTAQEYDGGASVNVDMTSVPGSVLLDDTVSTAGTLTIQPGASGIDSYIAQDKPTDNHGTDQDIRIDSEAVRSMRIVLRFDLSSVPWGATVDSANLWLYGIGGSKGGDVYYDVHALVNNTFAETEVTWNRYNTTGTWITPGGDYDPYSFANGIFDGSGGWTTTNVTRLVDLWATGTISNRGMILVPVLAGGDAVKVFQSSDETGAPSYNPKLVVNFTVAGDVGAAESDVFGPGTNGTITFAEWGNATHSLISDEFDGTSLDDGWSWLNDPTLDGGAYDVGAHRSGWLHVEGASSTALVDDIVTANYLRKTVVGDFDATISLDDSFTQDSMSAGILLMEDEDDWACVAKTGPNASASVQVTVSERGTSTLAADIDWAGLSHAYLRMVRNDTGLWMYAGDDGIAWTFVHWFQPQMPLAQRAWIGPFVLSASFYEPVVDFDFIRVEPLTDPIFEIMFRTGNSTDTSDPSWEDWGVTVGPYSYSPGEVARYAQFRIYLETSCEWVTPEFTGLSCWFEHYIASGSVETSDYEPADFDMWYTLTTSETHGPGMVEYFYSTDRGVSWTYVGTGGSYTIMSTEATLRVRVTLESYDTLGTPEAHSLTVIYGTSIASFFVLAPETVVVGEPFAVTVYAKDASNATMIHWTGPVTLEAMDPTATMATSSDLGVGIAYITGGGYVTVPNEAYTAAETITIVARSDDAFGVSSPVHVLVGQLDSVHITPDVHQIVEFNSQAFNATALDMYGNDITDAEFAWSVTGGIGFLDTTSGGHVVFTAYESGPSGLINVTADGVVTDSLVMQVIAEDHVPLFTSALPDQVRAEDFGSWTFDLSPYVTDPVDADSLLKWYTTNESVVAISGENRTGVMSIIFSTLDDVFGDNLVQIHVVDTGGFEAVATILVSVTPVNDGPTIDTVDPLIVTGGTPYPFNVRYYIDDIDTAYENLSLLVDDDSEDYCIVSRLTIVLTYPVEMVGLTTTVVVTVTDGELQSSTIIQVTVSEDNVPTVTDDFADISMYEGDARLREFDLDDYFMDPDGDTLTYTASFEHVWVNITTDHWVNFFAPMDWYGDELIVFKAFDSVGARVESAVLVTVLPVNQMPWIEGVPGLMVRYNETFEFDILPYIGDPDDAADRLVVSTNDSCIVVMGTTLFLTYPYALNGTVMHVAITVNDGELTASCNITVTVSDNRPPVAEQMQDHQFLEDIPLPYPLLGDLEDFFHDPEDGQVADIESFAWDERVIASSTPSGLGDWLMNFATEVDWYGETHVTVRATDSEGAIVEGTFTLTVVSSPDAPSFHAIDGISVAPGAKSAFDISGFITDPDTEPAQFTYAITGGEETQYVSVAAGVLMVEFPLDFLGSSISRTVTVTVTVLDQDGLSDDTVVTITVVAAPVGGGMDSIELIVILAMATIAAGSLAVAIRMRKRPFVIRDLLLVHNDGFLIGRHAAPQAGEIDEDVLTGMLTAVLNFVEDSMATSQDELKSFGFRDYQVLVKRGWKVYIAVVYSGDAPDGIQASLGVLLETIEKIYRKALIEWSGDIEVEFAGIELLLKSYVKDHGRHLKNGQKTVRLWQGRKKTAKKTTTAVDGGKTITRVVKRKVEETQSVKSEKV